MEGTPKSNTRGHQKKRTKNGQGPCMIGGQKVTHQVLRTCAQQQSRNHTHCLLAPHVSDIRASHEPVLDLAQLRAASEDAFVHGHAPCCLVGIPRHRSANGNPNQTTSPNPNHNPTQPRRTAPSTFSMMTRRMRWCVGGRLTVEDARRCRPA